MQLLNVDLILVRLNGKNMHGKKHTASDSILISSSSYHDLTHLIFEDMPTYPGEPKPEFSPHFRLRRDKVNVTKLTMSSHTGTHVDAPKHFISNGQGVDSISLNDFIGETVILDVSKKEVGHGITDTELDIHKKMVKGDDILLLYSGTSTDWNKNENRAKNFTYLEPTAAAWIVDHNIKCVGIDSCSIEKYGFKEGLTHKKLLSNGVGIIEGINSNLRKFIGARMFLVCLPLLLKDLDGSPARAILFDIKKSKQR
jgi:arylformamidase